MKLATGSSAGLYFFHAAFISSMVFCTSSSPPMPPMRTPLPALRLRGRDIELRRGALQLLDRVADEAARAQAVLDRVECCLHARRLLLQLADGADRGVVLHEAPGEVPGRRQTRRRGTPGPGYPPPPRRRGHPACGTKSFYRACSCGLLTVNLPPSLRLEDDALNRQTRLGRLEFFEPCGFHRIDLRPHRTGPRARSTTRGRARCGLPASRTNSTRTQPSTPLAESGTSDAADASS